MIADLPRAILFDLDDTILAAGQRPEILREVAREFEADLVPFAPDDIAERLDAALTVFWSDPERHKVARFGVPEARRQVIAETFAALASEAFSPDLADRFAARFTAWRDQLTDFFPGARETIEALKARGVLLALVTNGGTATQRAKIERFDLAPLFDHIQVEGEHAFGKPDPRAYRHAMSVLGVEAHETWMVGDHLEWEVAAPQKLGIFAVWHDPYCKGLPADSPTRPDRTIRAISELLASR
ncbi:HAD family hydrolase [Caulobacter mirabilis]|uniref:Phosphoglycolate phosphatase n=1 Tax=Caulobacter mirabilis TaxID=69666 RepID=A0A2D2AXV9_9CAUL|nr:HAD family hydrolase [Caulobacter mirabilis]ATQ42859.1 phosphoglycolate phosphatase [Caulobacter mirabilis]